MISLEDALTFGEGVERAFNCPDHADSNASASVNVLKGVWYCYACHASGATDKKKAPTTDMLIAMMSPEKACRVYPEQYLTLFADPGYWLGRFPKWLCWFAGLGEDPFTGDAVFPVRTAEGRLAGVGRRRDNPPPDEPRYKYPYRWSASTTMFGLDKWTDVSNGWVLVVEGAADAVACWEIGAPAFSAFGSSLHLPQRELLARRKPGLLLLGQDADDAGRWGAQRSEELVRDLADVRRVRWPRKDPAECSVPQRREAIRKTVVAAGYPDPVDMLIDNTKAMHSAYDEYLKDVA